LYQILSAIVLNIFLDSSIYLVAEQYNTPSIIELL